MGAVFEKHGCRLEVSSGAVHVKIRFRGSVAIPFDTIRAVRTSQWRSTRLIQIETPEGTYEWALGDRAHAAATAIAAAVGLPEPAALGW